MLGLKIFTPTPLLARSQALIQEFLAVPIRNPLPARFGHAGNLARKRQFAETEAAQLKFPVISAGTSATLAPIVRPYGEFRRHPGLGFFTISRHNSILPLLLSFFYEWHPQSLQQLICLVIAPCAGDNRNIHATRLVNLAIVDFRENKLVL